jgi:hypothetical protein
MVVSKFATLVQDAMAKQRVSIRDMQDVTGMTYEHTRKLVKGLAHPSPNIIRAFAEKLQLNADELEKMSVEYRIKSRYGRVSSVLAGISPRMEALAAVEPFLNERDIEELVSLANMKARINRTMTGNRRSRAAA